jgi:uncharacterized short protein YbdD (DUF466 family)
MTGPRSLLALLASAFRLMVGQSDYRAYRAHMAAHHPDLAAMDERAFFRHRQEARYGSRSGGRCC